MTTKYSILATLLALSTAVVAHASDLVPGRTQLLCHRMANKDVPENTLESLQQAALLGCNVVEIDLRRTLDGKIVLDHDGVLERLTDGVGDVETSDYDDLRLRDAGSWMGDRFAGLRIPLFDDALRLARERDIRLILDIKDKGIGADVLPLLRQEGMLQRVRFGGEWADVKQLYPQANSEEQAWVPPGVTAAQVDAFHRAGKVVIANFSANEHEMDLAAMKAAVAAGADAINVDYPRLGADAVGRPVESRVARLVAQAGTGASDDRARVILELSKYRGLPLRSEFQHLLLDPDAHVSYAAATALVMARPETPPSAFRQAIDSKNADARANAAWALGRLQAPAALLLPLLQDRDPDVLTETLVALSRTPGPVSAQLLLPLLANTDPQVRGAAAIALAYQQPQLAVNALPAQLRLEVQAARRLYDDWARRGKPTLTQPQIAVIMGHYRCQMKLMQAISILHGPAITEVLEQEAFRPGQDFSGMNSVVAAFQLWDRIGQNAEPAIQQLGADDASVADRAEWILIQGGSSVLPDLRRTLKSPNAQIRKRAIRIVAWQGDADALPRLQAMQQNDAADALLLAWAIAKIKTIQKIQFQPSTTMGATTPGMQ